MKLFYRKIKHTVGDRKVQKIVGSQIIKIVPQRFLKIMVGFTSIFAGFILSIPLVVGVNFNFEFYKMSAICLGFIVYGVLEIYRSFTKYEFKFNTFLKTIHYKKEKFSFSDVCSIQYASSSEAMFLLKNETYNYVAFLTLKSGRNILLLDDNSIQELTNSVKYIANECNFEYSKLNRPF